MLRTTLTGFFADQEQVVDNASNRIRCTVNPLLNPFPSAYLFQTSFGGGNRDGARIREGGQEREGKMVVSALYKELECKVEKLNIE